VRCPHCRLNKDRRTASSSPGGRHHKARYQLPGFEHAPMLNSLVGLKHAAPVLPQSVERQRSRLTGRVLVADENHAHWVDAFEAKQVVEGQSKGAHFRSVGACPAGRCFLTRAFRAPPAVALARKAVPPGRSLSPGSRLALPPLPWRRFDHGDRRRTAISSPTFAITRSPSTTLPLVERRSHDVGADPGDGRFPNRTEAATLLDRETRRVLAIAFVFRPSRGLRSQ
jgi:hypothetical protein